MMPDVHAMEATFNYLPLLIVLLLAFIAPLLLNRIPRIPVVVGEIVAGLIVGGSALGLVKEDLILALIGDIGLAFLMFLAGMEIDFDMLFPRPVSANGNGSPKAAATENGAQKPNLLMLAVFIYLITLVLAGGGAYALAALGLEADPWLLTFILGATSLGVLLPILKERGLTRTIFGQVVFVSATLADFITVILLTVFLIIISEGLNFQIFAISLLFVAFFIAYRLGIRFTRIPGVRRVVEELSRSTVQLKVRGAIAILLAFVVLAQFVNAELILGAFLAGMVISLIKSPQDAGLVHTLEAFGFGFFIPVFFILVGVNLELNALWESPESLLLLPAFLLISLVVKIAPLLLARKFLSWRQIFGGGLLLDTHLSLEIAVTIIGLRIGLLSAAAATTITLYAILTVLIMPLLFGVLVPPAPEAKHKMILVGSAGREGLSVARELQAHGETVCVLDDDPETLQSAREAGFTTWEGGLETISAINGDEYKAILALCSNDKKNLRLGQLGLNAGIQQIIARVNEASNLTAYKELGIQPFLPSLAQSTMLALMARNPDFYSLLTSVTDSRDVRELDMENYRLVGRRLRDMRWPGELLVLSINRGRELIIPHGNIQLEFEDRLTVLGSLEELEQVEEMLSV